MGQSPPKRDVRVTSAFPPVATEERTFRIGSYGLKPDAARALMCSNETGHLFPVSISEQDVRCRICKLRIHFVGWPTEMRG